MYYSKICNHVHPHALNVEVVGKRERGNDVNLVRYINDVNDLETRDPMLECGRQVMCTCV